MLYELYLNKAVTKNDNNNNKKATNLLSIVAVHFIFSPAMYERSRCSVSSPALGIVSMFYFSYFNRYEVIFHCELAFL